MRPRRTFSRILVQPLGFSIRAAPCQLGRARTVSALLAQASPCRRADIAHPVRRGGGGYCETALELAAPAVGERGEGLVGEPSGVVRTAGQSPRIPDGLLPALVAAHQAAPAGQKIAQETKEVSVGQHPVRQIVGDFGGTRPMINRRTARLVRGRSDVTISPSERGL